MHSRSTWIWYWLSHNARAIREALSAPCRSGLTVTTPLSLHCVKLLSPLSLPCFDLYDLSRRSSGLVSRPLGDPSLSPCVTGRHAGHAGQLGVAPENVSGGDKKNGGGFFFLSPKVFSPWKHVRVILYRNINMILYPSLRFLLSTQHDNQIIIKKIKIYTLLINNYFIKLSLLVFFFLPHCH